MTESMIQHARDSGKEVAVPLIDRVSNEIRALKITSLTRDLTEGMFGVREPITEVCVAVDKGDIDIVLVPGIAFDMYGYRLGYGKGYYDRWLKWFLKEERIGLCFDSQIVDRLPHGRHDRAVGIVVTDKRTIVAPRYIMQRTKSAIHNTRMKGVENDH
jgi:5-formyltetrahydrofolate cyclo-ligase